jgi:hypothetical protein
LPKISGGAFASKGSNLDKRYKKFGLGRLCELGSSSTTDLIPRRKTISDASELLLLFAQRIAGKRRNAQVFDSSPLFGNQRDSFSVTIALSAATTTAFFVISEPRDELGGR